jgi:hypothetical protein
MSTATIMRLCRAPHGLVVRVAIAGALSCGSPAADPADTVERYFDLLARDPVRTLPLLTDDFHRRHGLGVVTADEARRLARGERGGAAAAPAGAPADRYQMGWLAIQSREPYRVLRDRLAVTREAVEAGARAAVVTVRVEPDAAPAFVQRFELVRAGPADRWRIDAVMQLEVAPPSQPAAFVAWPNEAARRRLEASRPAP